MTLKWFKWIWVAFLSIHNILHIFCQLYDNYIAVLQHFQSNWPTFNELWYQSTIVCLFSASYMMILQCFKKVWSALREHCCQFRRVSLFSASYMMIICLFMVQRDMSRLQWALIPIYNNLPIFCQLYDNYIPILQHFQSNLPTFN